MTVLNVIFSITAIVANAAMTFFAAFAFTSLRRLRKDVDSMGHGVAITTTLVMGSHVRENFEEVTRMKEAFNRLVENEQYEEAQKLRDAIEKAERAAKASLERFRKTCGGIAEITVAGVRYGREEYDDDDD